ncbi:MAG TPA: serine hydrolase domain-containing protein [Terriglobales bacterium]|nr:serine hydrolase domain-containing protein [Terriglobales bacterium]
MKRSHGIPLLLALIVALAAETPLAGHASARAQATAGPTGVVVDKAVLAEMKQQRIPGLALGVYRDGQIVRVQGYGLANIELNVPVKPETLFQSGSVGKQFVSMAIMMLVEEGKVNLEDSITNYFPDAPATWKPIRVKNLLSHTSGLAEYESDERTKPGAPFYLRLDHTEPELLKMIEAMPIENAPGDKWAYRNTNYVLLGMLIHKVTGEFYADFLTQRIFKPLGMNSTRLISEADIIPNRAAGYQIEKGELKNQDWVSPTYNSTADGALYFNVLDLAKWDAALYTEKLVKKSSLDQMWTVFKLNDGKPNPGHYGFGWDIDEVNGHRVLEHGGAWQGFTCFIARYLDDKLTVVALTNLDSDHSKPAKIVHAVAGMYDPALAPASR